MATTQISRQDNRTPIYYIGLVREGRKLIIQAKESVDDLSCEITDYLGPRQVSKATIEANKTILLEGFKADPKYRHCDMVEVQEPLIQYTRQQADQIAYLERMQRKLTNVYNAIYELTMHWDKDGECGFDMNEYLADKYPFVQSCDDLSLEVELWYTNAWVVLNKQIKVLQGYPVEKVYGIDPKIEEAGVKEPPAPYYTPEQAEGKWICAFDTMCNGWECVRYSGGDKDGYPVLYNSQKDVEEDSFFDPDDDFAIPATEFIEGRKAIFGGNGLHITGTPIVKGYKIIGNTTTKAEEPEVKYNQIIRVAKAWQSNEYYPDDIDIIELILDFKDRLRLMEAMEKCKLYGYDYIAMKAGTGARLLSHDGELSEMRTDVEYFKCFKTGIYFYAQSKWDASCQIESEVMIVTEGLGIELPDHAEYEIPQQ